MKATIYLKKMSYNKMIKYTFGLAFFIYSFLTIKAQEVQYIPYRIGNKWGYSDTSGKLILEANFQSAEFFKDGVAFVKKDSFYYLINIKGEIIGGEFLQHGNYMHGLCPVQLTNGMYIYINTVGNMAIKFLYKAAEDFSEERAIVKIGLKLGIINTKGEWVKEPGFASSSIYYKGGFIMTEFNGNYNYLNKQGKVLVLPSNVSCAGPFSEGLAAVYVKKEVLEKGKITLHYMLEFIDTTGAIVLDSFINDGTDYSEYINYVSDFKNGKAIIKVSNNMGFDFFFIDKKKRFSPAYSAAQNIGDSLFIAAFGFFKPRIKIINKNLFPLGVFDENPIQIGEMSEGLVGVKNSMGFWGFASSNCKILIPYIYSKVGIFYNSFSWVIKQDKEGYINSSGKEFFREE